MKIKINNIFNNKEKTKDKEKDLSFRKQKKKVLENGNQINIKKIYDANEESLKINDGIEKNEVRKRKGASDSGKNEGKKEPSIKLYYQNLVKNKNKLSKGYYLLLFLMVALGAGSVVIAGKTYNLFKQEDYEVFGNTDGEEVIETFEEEKNDEENLELQSDETSNKDTIEEIKKEEPVKGKEVKKQNVVEVPKVVPLVFSAPVSGEVIKPYSPNNVIYSKTLELWKVHDGIDIKVDEGTYIKSIEKGTVEKVYEDAFYGVTIVIDHGQGYKSSYSNLDKDVLISERQTVVKGAKIGKIGKTAIGEIKDDSHLHFMLFKNGVSEDPTNIFK